MFHCTWQCQFVSRHGSIGGCTEVHELQLGLGCSSETTHERDVESHEWWKVGPLVRLTWCHLRTVNSLLSLRPAVLTRVHTLS